MFPMRVMGKDWELFLLELIEVGKSNPYVETCCREDVMMGKEVIGLHCSKGDLGQTLENTLMGRIIEHRETSQSKVVEFLRVVVSYINIS